MPLLYSPRGKHDCLRDHRFDVTLNQDQANIPLGTLWICPDCGGIFGFFGRTVPLHPLVNGPLWEKVSVRQAQRMMRRGN